MKILKTLITIMMIMIILIIIFGCANKKPIQIHEGLQTKALIASANLQWDPNIETDLDGYEVHYDNVTKCPNNDNECIDPSGTYSGTGAVEGNSPIQFPLTSLSDINNPQVSISGLDNSINYFFSVTAYDDFNNISGFSNQVMLTATNPPEPPDITLTDITLLWDANSETDLDGYNVYWSLISGAPYEFSQTLYLTDFIDPSNPEYSLQVDRCLTWYFVVTAFDNEDPPLESDYSNEVFALETCPPEPPININISYSQN